MRGNFDKSMSSQSQLPTQVELPRVKCAFHPTEAITNFCICESCLLPLCPSCIKIHTIEHIDLKKINPQYQPITDLLQEIYEQVQELLEQNNENYKKIVEIDARVDTFRSTIQQKINSIKQNILNEVEKYFAKIDEDIQTRIDNMTYIQLLDQYKDQTKKVIIGLKNIEKGFNPQNEKIMRIVIKYKGGFIKKELDEFKKGCNEFFKEVNSNFVTFSVREDYRQIIASYLDSIKRVEVADVQNLCSVSNVAQKIREVYEKNDTENKKEIIRSIGTFLGNHSSKKIEGEPKNCQNENYLLESYNSLSSKISRNNTQAMFAVRENTPTRDENQRRSLSKGKGLSILQINNTVMAKNNPRIRIPKAVNISQPMDFNRTTFVRRDNIL